MALIDDFRNVLAAAVNGSWKHAFASTFGYRRAAHALAEMLRSTFEDNNPDILAVLDGDKLDITWNPTNYTPDATPPEADDVDDLAAHLQGIDTALAGGGGGPVADTWFRAFRGSTQNVSGVNNATVLFDDDSLTDSGSTFGYDTGSNFNTSTGIYTVPEDGTYLIQTTVQLGNLTATQASRVEIQVHTGAFYTRRTQDAIYVPASNVNTTYHGTLIAQLLTGDLVRVQAFSGGDTSWSVEGNSAADRTVIQGGRLF